jgi:hypothetical protein
LELSGIGYSQLGLLELYKSFLGVQFLIYLTKHLANFFLKLSIALEYILSEGLLVVLIRVL